MRLSRKEPPSTLREEPIVAAVLPFNPHVAELSPPPIPLAQSWLAGYGGEVGAAIDLSQAVPGYAPHPEVLAALGRVAAGVGAAGYGAIEGEAELRAAYGAHVGQLYGATIGPERVQITAGCNQAFVVAALAVAGPGEGVLLTNPCYFNHEQGLQMLGIRPGYVACRPEDGFLPNLLDIETALKPGVRALAIVTPNNPTGAIYGADLLAEIAALCRRRGVRLIIDETYRDFRAPGADAPHGLLADPGLTDTVVQLYSFSKAYCIPGHRLGAIVAGPQTIQQVAKVMDNLQICAPRAGQIAVAGLIEATHGWRLENAGEIERRAATFRAAVAPLDGWRIAAMGAYFAYLRHPFDGVSSTRVAEALARRRGILTLPGAFFGTGQDDHLRVAFANVTSGALAAVGPRLAGFTLET
ncbi:MAG: aminotransferase [Rhizobiales bacterium]|nr:aminotransferase [Hyphomicrobiales bacterium]